MCLFLDFHFEPIVEGKAFFLMYDVLGLQIDMGEISISNYTFKKSNHYSYLFYISTTISPPSSLSISPLLTPHPASHLPTPHPFLCLLEQSMAH